MQPKSFTQLMTLGMPVPVSEILSDFADTSSTQENLSTQEKLLEIARSRNGLLDRYFYHVEPEDEERVVKFNNVHGSIIVVNPDISNELIYLADAVDFFEKGFDKEDKKLKVSPSLALEPQQSGLLHWLVIWLQLRE